MLGATKILTTAFQFFGTKLNFYLATQTEDSWRYGTLKHYYNLPLSYVDQQDSGQIGSRIERGGGCVWSLLHQLIGWDVCVNVLTLGSVLYAALSMEPQYWFVIHLFIDKISEHGKIQNKY